MDDVSISKHSMYGIFTHIYHEFRPNVGKNAIHWASGMCVSFFGFGLLVTFNLRRFRKLQPLIYSEKEVDLVDVGEEDPDVNKIQLDDYLGEL